jgi:hypothetical protein
MACALVWCLARSTAPEAAAARQLLQRLSGRQVAWGRDFTEEALLAGFWVLLAMLQVLRTQPRRPERHRRFHPGGLRIVDGEWAWSNQASRGNELCR